MEKTILTDAQVDSLVDVLGESRNETDSLIEEIERMCVDIDNSDAPLEEGEGQYISDGVIMGDGECKVFDFDHFKNIDNTIENIINDNIKDNLENNYNLTDEEVIKFANLIMRVRAKEKFNIYNELPKSVQEEIDKMINVQPVALKDLNTVRQYTAKMVIDELIADSELDALSIDLEKAMKELLPAPLEMYSEFNKEYIEEEFLKIAEEIKDENPNTAKNILAMREGYINAYTYENMYEVFKNSKIQKHVRRAEVEWSRTKKEYESVAGVCKFNLYSLADINKSLITLGFTDLEAKRIITLFVYTYTDGITDYKDETQYNDINRNAFANYFEINIKNLAIGETLLSDFSKQIKLNLQYLNDHIDDAMIDLERELSNKKNKKRG